MGLLRRSLSRFLAVCLIAAVIPACVTTDWDPTDYTVKSGDTVYSIAWRYELDAEQFASWNGISTASKLRAGDRLHTRKPARPRQPVSKDQDVAYAGGHRGDGWIIAEKGDTLYAISRSTGVSVDELVRLNRLSEPYTIQPGQKLYTKPVSTADAGSSKAVSVTRDKVKWPSSVKWHKPATGKIVKKYQRGKTDAKGIHIAGNKGDPVLAAADGKVVYSGDGLISYGNLVIIKHSPNFLSAYAYNQKLLVKEGQTVNAGQKIALMGTKDRLGPRLHFEIRKNGKPVDPLKYLPW